MNKLIRIALLLCLAAIAGFAQTYTLTPTTLSTAIADAQAQVMTIASATTVSGYTIVSGTAAYIDNELVTIKPLNGLVTGTTFAISRGQGGTTAAPHASSSLVFIGPPNAFFSKPGRIEPQGSCTRSKLVAVPMINVATGVISDCLGGSWIQGDKTAAPRFRVYSPEPGGTAYTSLNTNGTSLIATEVYCSELFLPANKLLTGAAVLAGTTVTSDKWYMILYDSAGNKLANSAVAGATLSGASTYQQQAFTSTFYAVGPAQYFVCFQSNGTTATARMAVTGVNDNILTAGQTSAVFGTIPALTVPTSFTTAVGPYVYVY